MWNTAKICNHINALWEFQILRTQIAVNLTTLHFKNTTIILSNKIKVEQSLREVQEGNWIFKIQKTIKDILVLNNQTFGWTLIRSGLSMAGFIKLMEISLTISFSTRFILWIFLLDHTQFTNKKFIDCNKQVLLLFLTFRTIKTSLTLEHLQIKCHTFTEIRGLISLLTKMYVIIPSQSTLTIYLKQLLHSTTFMISRSIRFIFMIRVVCLEFQPSFFVTWPYSVNLKNGTTFQPWPKTSKFNIQCQIPTFRWFRL